MYKNGANWGRDAFGKTTGLHNAADTAGDMFHTGIEAEPEEERHDDE